MVGAWGCRRAIPEVSAAWVYVRRSRGCLVVALVAGASRHHGAGQRATAITQWGRVARLHRFDPALAAHAMPGGIIIGCVAPQAGQPAPRQRLAC